MRANRGRDTAPEMALRSALHRAGRRYRVHYPLRITPARALRPDIVFPRLRVAVYVDGCFWHGCPQHWRAPRANREYWEHKIARNQARDAAATAALLGAGWVVVRVWEHESPATALARVEAALDDRGRSANLRGSQPPRG
jgi:DNA mismatch endonuclease (patch repair protein)